MRAFVTILLPDGRCLELGHGDLVGRLWTCACAIDDPRISEAHALVSLRGASFKLLALRGRFGVGSGGDFEPMNEVQLAPGQHIQLARGLVMEVIDVELPAELLALEGDTLARQVLTGVTSILAGPRVELAPGHRPEAAVVIWSNGREWRYRRPASDDAGEVLVAGLELAVEAHRIHVVSVPLRQAGQAVTTLREEQARPMHLVVRYPTVHIQRSGEPPAAIDGLPARIIGELVAFGVPTPWEVLARELWPGAEEPAVLRRRFDVALARLRRRLREIGVRTDIVRADGTGSFELMLGGADTVESTL